MPSRPQAEAYVKLFPTGLEPGLLAHRMPVYPVTGVAMDTPSHSECATTRPQEVFR
ncbi:hypothetical protein GCM10023075_33810 [Streptosporangium album]|uniref:hypothetical protein n=1 Tax=Streptosporangium album TaxID=47479 RepID=UPI0031E7B018